MKLFRFMHGIALGAICGCGQPILERESRLEEAWNARNDPINLRGDYEVGLAGLPLAGESESKPWTDSYWPNSRGGLADRWRDQHDGNGFSYALLSRSEIQGMSLAELERLSPAEKYDLYVGRYDFPFVKHERQRNNARDPSWYGLCHGWAAAALNFREPKPVVVTSPEGLAIPFGSSDVKALLTFGQHLEGGGLILGERCNHDLTSEPSHANDPACRDTNAGAFHVVLANEIGRRRSGFVAEITRGLQVWNQPVFGYESRVLSRTNEVYRGAALGTVEVVTVQTRMGYVAELGANWEAVPFAEYPEQASWRTYDYTLELDGRGQIIGGEWVSEPRPDFLWTQRRARLGAYFNGVQAIYEASIR